MKSTNLEPMLNLRVSRNNNEISETINSMFVDSSPVMLWQNQHGNRVVTYATILNIDFENNQIIMQANQKNRFEKFSKDFTIYIRGPQRSILFKQTKCRLNANKLALAIPSEVRLYEQRLLPRFNTPDKKNIEAYFDKRIGAGVGSDKSFAARVINLSQEGLCLEIIQNMGKFFYEGDSVFLSNLNNISFDSKLEAVIVYLKKTYGSNSDRMQMGIRFKSALSQELLRKIVKEYFLH